MKRTLLFVLALIAVGCAEQIPRNLDDLVQQGEDTYLDRETMRPYSGPVFRLMDADTSLVRMRGHLTDGRRSGTWESWYYNGQLERRIVFSDEGLVTEEFYDNGQLKEAGSSDSNGLQHGQFTFYDRNGVLRGKTPYLHGEVDGKWERCDDRGGLIDYGYLSNGKECGEGIEDGKTVTHDPCPPGGN